MRIAAFEPLTLIDYPDKLASVVFTPGCVLRCPYCHNPELIANTENKNSAYFCRNREEEFFDFLKTRRGVLEGVVVTGGEPTLHSDLLPFLHRIKKMGFLVKLDTNGVFPDRVREILRENIVDYWAMDIKHRPEKYAVATGISIPIERFRESADLLMQSGVPYEFRTTVVPGIHAEEDFPFIGQWINGAARYYLQTFRNTKIADTTLPSRIGEKKIDLRSVKQSLLPYFDMVDIRE